MNALGCHLLLELKGCPIDRLKDRDFIEKALVEATVRSKTHIISKHFHTFNPHGVSGAVVIAESHLSIHTWPEYGYAALDIFTCGDNALPHAGTDYLIEAFQPEEYELMHVDRGRFGVEQRLLAPKVITEQENQAENSNEYEPITQAMV